MSERIVVCFRLNSEPKGSVGVFEVAQALMLRAKAFGATLCMWSMDSLAFSFQPEDLEEAVGFVTGADGKQIVGSLGVGMSRGSLDLLARDGQVEPAWGPGLVEAFDLSRHAEANEILVASNLLSSDPVQLETRGTRMISGSTRAHILMSERPFRTREDRLPRPPLQGCDGLWKSFQIAPGTLATIRAAQGLGGTRFLEAMAERSARTPCLLLFPTGHRMEPLGALRCGMSRVRSLGKAPSLPQEHFEPWSVVSEAMGADPASVAEMLEAWLACPHPEGGLLLIDDANDIDASTLDVIATALLGAETPFRAVARLDHDSPLPAELAPLPPGPEIELVPLGPQDAGKLLNAWTGDEMTDVEAEAWAARAGGIPLALAEAIFVGTSTGELVWNHRGARLRAMPHQTLSPVKPSELIARRFRFLTPGSRATLIALAVLGGDASNLRIVNMLEASADIPVDLELEKERLSKAGWLRCPEPNWLSLLSHTHLQVVFDAIPEGKRGAWHRSAANILEATGTLELAEAAWHAAVANDRGRAQRLAKHAAIMARAAGLQTAARDLEAFARAHDPAPQPRIESEASGLIPRLPMASSPGDPEDIFPVALADRGPKRPSRYTFPPVEVSDEEMLSEPPCDSGDVPPFDMGSLDTAPLKDGLAVPSIPKGKVIEPRREPALELARRPIKPAAEVKRISFGPPIPGGPPNPGSPLGPMAPPDVFEAPVPSERRGSYRDSQGSIHELTLDDAIESVFRKQAEKNSTDLDEPDSESEPTIVNEPPADRANDSTFEVVRILRDGNIEEIDRWAQQVGDAPELVRMVERVRAIAELRRGNSTEALRVLRNACEQARSLSTVERSRSRLAFALGLAHAGRSLEALVEGLEGLSRAREAGDTKAEEACLGFLRKLYADRKHEDANAWRSRH